MTCSSCCGTGKYKIRIHVSAENTREQLEALVRAIPPCPRCLGTGKEPKTDIKKPGDISW